MDVLLEEQTLRPLGVDGAWGDAGGQSWDQAGVLCSVLVASQSWWWLLNCARTSGETEGFGTE